MGSRFLDVLKDMGVFLLCVRSLMHLTADKSYEKYIRMLCGMVILIQLAEPVSSLYADTSADELWKEVERMETALAQDMEAYRQSMLEEESLQEASLYGEALYEKSFWKQEVIDRLQIAAADFGLQVMNVTMIEEYRILRISLSLSGAPEKEISIEPIQVGDHPPGEIPETEFPEGLKDAFAGILGTSPAELELQWEDAASRTVPYRSNP